MKICVKQYQLFFEIILFLLKQYLETVEIVDIAIGVKPNSKINKTFIE